MTDRDQLAGWQGPSQPLMLESSNAPNLHRMVKIYTVYDRAFPPDQWV